MDGGVNVQRFMTLYWQTHVLGHYQRPEVLDHLWPVNTQLPTADDGIWLHWNIRIQNVSVDDHFWYQFSKLCIFYNDEIGINWKYTWITFRYYDQIQNRNNRNFDSLKGALDKFSLIPKFPPPKKNWNFCIIRGVYPCIDCMLNLICSFNSVTKIYVFYFQ